MNAKTSRMEQARERLALGTLSPEEAVRRLSDAIEAEYQKEHADTAFISACEDLLWEMHTAGTQPFASANEQYKTAMAAHSRRVERTVRPAGLAWKSAAVLAACLCLLLAGSLLHWQRVNVASTPDGQQYVIQGQEIGVEVISRCLAAHDGIDQLQTEDPAALADFLGFTVPCPDLSDADLTPDSYAAFILPDRVDVTIHYGNADGSRNAVFCSTCFASAENMYITYEQDGEGVTQLIGGVEVYLSTNMGRKSCTWTHGLNVFHLSGDIDRADSLTAVEKLISGMP